MKEAREEKPRLPPMGKAWYAGASRRGGQGLSDTVHGYQTGRGVDTPILVTRVAGW